MFYETPRCSVCHRNTDRSPMRKIGIIGYTEDVMVEEPVPDKRKKSTVQHVQPGLPRIMYQCSTCAAVFIVNGELQPTQNPLEEIPLISE